MVVWGKVAMRGEGKKEMEGKKMGESLEN